MVTRLLLGLTLLVATPAWGQTPPSDLEPEAPTSAAPDNDADAEAEAGEDEPDFTFDSADAEIGADEWQQENWILKKPEVTFWDLDGYLRLRGTMLRRLDFNNDSVWESRPRFPLSANGNANFSTTNMRLRLEPRINISQNLQIVTTIDVFDNLSLGSTPDTIPLRSATPVDALSRSQGQLTRGVNALNDAIFVRRVWGRATALNEQLELRFGRMPDHWGLGILANSGDCLDCDYGHSVDRIALSFRLAGHLFMPMYDWVATGPVFLPFGAGQPLDATLWDDVVQYSLRITRMEHEDDIEAKRRDGLVVNYGLWNAIRVQNQGVTGDFYDNGEFNPNAVDESLEDVDLQDPADRRVLSDEKRDAFIYILDAFVELYKGRFELRAEGALTVGHFDDKVLDGVTDQTTDVLMAGGALEARYRLHDLYKGTYVGLKAGLASGDLEDGFGALDQSDTQRGNPTNGSTNRELTNFQFSPDYHVDMLIFRRIIGTVTDAWYLRPEVSYMFDRDFAGRLAVIYSQAMLETSTASCHELTLAQNRACSGGSKPMGLEVNAELSYGLAQPTEEHGIRAALAGALAFPFGAFDRPVDNLAPDGSRGGNFAWGLQGRLYLTF